MPNVDVSCLVGGSLNLVNRTIHLTSLVCNVLFLRNKTYRMTMIWHCTIRGTQTTTTSSLIVTPYGYQHHHTRSNTHVYFPLEHWQDLSFTLDNTIHDHNLYLMMQNQLVISSYLLIMTPLQMQLCLLWC